MKRAPHKLRKQVHELNRIIFCRNLYCNGRRLINAELAYCPASENGDESAHWYITLQDLWNDSKSPLDVLTMNGQKLLDGNGSEVITANL